MNRRKIIFLVVSALFITVISSAVFIANADYSVTNDPLITLSYVNETLIPKLEAQITERVLASLKGEDIETPVNPEIPSESPTEPEAPEDTENPGEPIEPTPSVDLSGLKYIVVHLTKGQKLFANGENTESLEIVLRAGEALSISPFHDQGIADLTASTQLYNGDPMVKNNYCIIPRGRDGRGIEVISNEAYFLVRGVYEVE
ncbi:MAG: hypothetical protein IKV53_04795 [Clostridia bacterium]|nr:hypothetical protein [Clostridia bacterium]